MVGMPKPGRPAHHRAVATTPAAPSAAPGSASALPLVGQDRETADLRGAVRAAVLGQSQFREVVGEAGIGKSRLVAEVARWARERHLASVVVVRSVEDDGAPPLWTLRRGLEGLSTLTGTDVPDLDRGVVDPDDDATETAQFALSAAMTDFVHAAASHHPVLVVVEDVQWCDPTTLRVLRHLVERTTEVPLALITTSRPEEDRRPARAALSTSITRAGGHRLDLRGLTEDAVASLVGLAPRDEAAAEDKRHDRGVARLHERTGGNPLYLQEILRAGGPEVEQLPDSLAGLVERRLLTLPDETVRALRIAAVAGREFARLIAGLIGESHRLPDPGGDLGADSGADLGADLDRALTVLEPARVTGILRERSDGTWLFAHSLVRDAVLDAMRPTERAARHAELAAALESATHDARARGEVARHWRAAGAQHAHRAWRATAAVAARAEDVFAFEEATGLLAEALLSQRLDPASTDLDRFGLLERRATACRLSSDWDGAAVAVIEALAVAERIEEPELAARAATSLPVGSIWHVQRYGSVSADLVHALRRCLGLVDATDSALRCRILLTIAMESFYVAGPAELDALVEEALALAEASGDDDLRCLALQQAYSARWRPGTREWRLDAAASALELARTTGNVRSEATCGALLAISLVEVGRVRDAQPVVDRALDLAGRHGFATVVTTLELMRVPLRLLAGRDDEAEASLDRVIHLQERVTGSNLGAAVTGARLLMLMWQRRVDEFVLAATGVPADSAAPLDLFAVMALLRLGLDAAARQLFASAPTIRPDETYMGMIVAAANAEVALRLGVAPLSEETYTWLRPYSGGVASAGSTTALGPVDAFLALAAAGSGRSAEAHHHAERALAQCAAWGMPRARTWLSELRRQYSF